MAGVVRSDVEEDGMLLLDSPASKMKMLGGVKVRVAMAGLAVGLLAMGTMTLAGKTLSSRLRGLQIKSTTLSTEAEEMWASKFATCNPKSSHRCIEYLHRSSEAIYRRKLSEMDPDVTSCTPKDDVKCKILSASWNVFEKMAELQAAAGSLEECLGNYQVEDDDSQDSQCISHLRVVMDAWERFEKTKGYFYDASLLGGDGVASIEGVNVSSSAEEGVVVSSSHVHEGGVVASSSHVHEGGVVVSSSQSHEGGVIVSSSHVHNPSEEVGVAWSPTHAERHWKSLYDGCSIKTSHKCRLYFHRLSEATFRRKASEITPDVTSCTPQESSNCKGLADEWYVWEKLAELEAAAGSLEECKAAYPEHLHLSQCASEIRILDNAEKVLEGVKTSSDDAAVEKAVEDEIAHFEHVA